MHRTPKALHFALLNAGRSMLARIAIMAMTTSNSMSVKALDRVGEDETAAGVAPRRG